uniref:MARVEL domain-containing protein n=1 Tax=Ditylum brightwellii TaxID=49249 RepID=A0A7S4VNK7_9STRA
MTSKIGTNSSLPLSLADDNDDDTITTVEMLNNDLSAPLLPSTEQENQERLEQDRQGYFTITKAGNLSCLIGAIASIIAVTSCRFVRLQWTGSYDLVISQIGFYRYYKETTGQCYSFDTELSHPTSGTDINETFFPDARMVRFFGIVASALGGLTCSFILFSALCSETSSRQQRNNSNYTSIRHSYSKISAAQFLACIFQGLTFHFFHQKNGSDETMFCNDLHSKCFISSGSVSAMIAMVFYFVSGVIFAQQCYNKALRRRR